MAETNPFKRILDSIKGEDNNEQGVQQHIPQEAKEQGKEKTNFLAGFAAQELPQEKAASDLIEEKKKAEELEKQSKAKLGTDEEKAKAEEAKAEANKLRAVNPIQLPNANVSPLLTKEQEANEKKAQEIEESIPSYLKSTPKDQEEADAFVLEAYENTEKGKADKLALEKALEEMRSDYATTIENSEEWIKAQADFSNKVNAAFNTKYADFMTEQEAYVKDELEKQKARLEKRYQNGSITLEEANEYLEFHTQLLDDLVNSRIEEKEEEFKTSSEMKALTDEMNKTFSQMLSTQYGEEFNKKASKLVNEHFTKAVVANEDWYEGQSHRIANESANKILQDNNKKISSLYAKHAKEFAEQTKGSFYGTTYIPKIDNKYLDAARVLNTKAASRMADVRTGEGFNGFGINFAYDLAESLRQTATLGAADIPTNNTVAEVFDKLASYVNEDNAESVYANAAEYLNEDEMLVYDAYCATLAAELARAKDTSYIATTSQMLAEMVPFFATMGIFNKVVGGANKLIQNRIMRGMTRFITNKLPKIGRGVRKAVTGLTTDIIGSGVYAAESAVATMLMPRTYAQTLQNKVDIKDYGFEGGKIIINELDVLDTPEALLKTAKEEWAGIYTEGKGLTSVLSNIVFKNPIMKKVLSSAKGTAIGKLMDEMAKVKALKLFSDVSFNGTLGEWSEELEGAFWSDVFGNDKAFEEFFSKDTQIPMIASFMIPSAIGAGFNIAHEVKYKNEFKKASDNAMSILQKHGYSAEDFSMLKDNIYATPTEDLQREIVSMAASIIGADQYSSAYNEYTTLSHKKENVGLTDDEEARLEASRKALFEGVDPNAQEVQQLATELLKMTYAEMAIANIDRSEKERLAEAREMARGYAQATEQMLAEQQAKEEIDTAIENGEEVDDATLEQHTREKVEEELMPTLVGIAFENGESEMGSQALYRVSRPDDTERKGYIVRGEATPQVEQGDEGLIFTNKDALVTVKWDDGTIEQTTLAKLNIDSTSTIAEQIEEEVQKQFLVARGKQTYKQGTAVTMQVPNVQTGEQETLQGRVLSTNENGVEVELVAQDGVTTTTNVDYASATQVLSVVPQQPSAPSAPSQSTQNEPVQASVTTPDANTMNAEQLASSALSFFDNDKDAVNGWIDAQAEEAKREIQELQKTKPTNTDAATYKAEWQAKQTALNNAMKRLQTLDQAKNIIANTQNAQQNANNSQNTLQSGNNSVSLQGKKSAAQEVIDNIDSGHFKTIVFNDENIEQLMRDAMLSQESIGSVMQTLATHGKGSVDGFYDPSTGVVFVYENQSKDKVRRKYVHERQHGLNAKNKKYINAILRVSKEKQLKDVVERISGTDFYSKKSLDIVADEFICRAMEIAYSVENDAQLENALRRIGASEEQIQIIKSINYEHGQDFNLSKARRTPYVFESTESTSGQSSRDSEEIPNRVLGQQGFRPSRPSESRTRGASEVTQDTSLEESGIQVNDETGDARFSVNYRLDAKQIDILAKQIAERVGVNKAKAKKWLKAETSLAALCMQEDNVDALYYFADGRYGAIKNNSDYPQGTVDFNNICRKRLDFTNIYLSLQREFPNKVFTAKDLETIRQIMIEDGLEVACGLCYVEDRRQLLGEIANEFRGFLKDRTIPEDLSATKKEVMQKVLDIVGDDAYIPTIAQLLEAGAYELRNSHPSIFEAFVVFNNSRGMQSGRLFEGYAEYKREILDWSDKKVKQVNDAGGLRIFSFSDFEAHHLIDIVQIINDAASKGVMIQGYTKVPEFARAIRSTKIKLNRSLIPLGDTGIQEVNGEKVLAYDTTEGIDVNSENFLDESNNPNVGNVLVGINDEQIRMAMEDANVNFIIPFHTGLKKDILLQKKIGAWVNYKNSQTEKDATTGSSKTADGKKVVGVNIYTDVLQAAEKDGTPIKNRKEFVEYFLKVCKERGLVPRFEQFLARGKNGEYKYTKGYEKLLVDFKMFDKRGNILPQEPVVPIFDDAFNQQIIEDYVKGTKETKEYESTKEKIKENLQLNESTDDLATSESQVRYSVVTDKKLLNELENGETIKVYRAMQLQDGKLYPPMSGKVEGEWRNPIELGVWEQADEAPDKAVERKGKDGQMKYVFKLDKGNKKSLYAAYNPYIHTSRTPLNDQFSEAQDRPELVTVEVEVPTSELTSGYKAKNAKDAVGELEWKAGVVQGQLTGTRKVILSRYDKPIRIVPNAEVAERIVEMIDGKDVVFPSNVVTPQLREELEKKGVQFKETDNQGKPRFSVTEGTQVVNLGDNTLVGLHNISQSKIRKAIKQGGLANPSAAVIDIAKQNHEGYGEITLVMPSKLVESETGRNAGTYTGDAWSPTYPYVELQLTEKGRDKYYDTLRETFKNEDVVIKNRMALVFENMLSNQGNPENLAYWYLLEKGIEPTKVMFNSGISDFVKERFATLREKGGVDNLNAEERELLIELAAEIDGKTKEDLLQEAQDRIKFLNITANSNDGFRRKMALATLEDIEEYGVSSRILSDAFYKIDRAMIKDGKLDVERTVSKARNYVEEQGMLEDLNSWIENLRDRFDIKEVIFDGYDRNGNRKYVPNTLSNVSRLMNRESEQNAYSNTGLSATRAMLIERLETLEDIRNNKHRLVAQSEQEQEEWDQMQDKWFNDVIEPLSKMQKVDSNPFINNDIAALRLIEAITKPNPIAYLNREYKYNIPLNGTYAKNLNEMIKQLKEMPTKYFETKFKRPVYLNEFSAAVVPQGLAEDVKAALQGFGMPLFEYDESVEGSRREATLKATEIEGVRFSIIGERGAANLDRAEEATTRLDNLSIAREMENANKDAKTIKAATGWERGADGKWRYETKDVKLKDLSWLHSRKKVTLADIIDDNDLFKAYPQLANIEIKKNNKNQFGGTYDSAENTITIGVKYFKDYVNKDGTWSEMLSVSPQKIESNRNSIYNGLDSTIKHEVQHAIQYIEGFAKGGNPSMYRPDFDRTRIDEMIDELNRLVDKYNSLSNYDRISYGGTTLRGTIQMKRAAFNRLAKQAALGLEGYKRLAGEVEARNVQKRASMSEEERRNTLLQETEDVAREDQLFIYHAIEEANKEIRFSLSNANQRIFVSNAERAVESIKQEKATPQQWKAMIEKQGGLKVGEDKWLGLSEWLDSKVASAQSGETKLDVANRIAKNTITKQEILDYIAEHQIQIEEVEYAEDKRKETLNTYEFEYEKWVESFEMDIEDGELEEDVDVYQLAFDEMVSKYGDDFAMAFEVGSNGELQLIEDMYGDNSAADYFLGGIKAINETRLKYTTKGLENKQEIALTVPTIESWNERDNVHFGDAGDGRAIAWIRFGETEVQTPREVIDHVDELQFAYTNANGQDVYAPQGSKFSKDYAVYGKLANGEMGYVLYVRNKQLSAHPTLEAALDALNAHYEANPRQETDYGKVLVIDEIQSKRHQEGRDKGYITKEGKEIKKKIKELTDKQDAIYSTNRWRRTEDMLSSNEEAAEYRRLEEEIIKLQQELPSKTGIIPDAPFDKNWHELAFKRMLRYAAENGYDYVAWTTGEQQAERYNLGQVVKEVHASEWQKDRHGFTEDGGEIKSVYAEMAGATNELQLYVDRNGKVVADINDQWVGRNLSEIFNKEIAVKLMAEGAEEITNAQLRIGGEGMKGFYDKMLPSFVSKYTKKWGAKVQDINLPNLEESAQTMHAVNVTQEMKDSVMEGQPMFSISAKEAQEYADAANEFAQLEELKQLKSLTNEIDYFTESRQFGWRDAKEKEFWGIVNSLRKNRFVKKLEAIIREAAAKSMPNTKVVDKKGRPLVVYHGTISKSKFNEFDTSEGRGLFFVKQEWQAKQYTHPRRTLWVSPSTTGRVIPAFINIENPYVIDAKRRLWRNIEVSWSETPVTTDDIVAYAKENGHDGVIIERVRDNMFDDDTSYTTEYIPFNSSQVKSTGAVYIEEKQTHFPFDTIDTILTEFGATYDDDGNLIPLSERFNLENADVRFSVKSEDPKPIGRGVFGYIYDQFKGKTQEAIDFLLRKKDGEALGALHHNEVGEIALVYGNNKGGLGKISIKHPEVLGNLQEIFDEMNIVQKSENRIKLESNTHFAVVSKDYKGTPRGAWLLTAFEKTNSVPDNTMDTGETLSGKQNDTATLQDTVSADKGTKNMPNIQINSQENENLSENPLFSVVNPTRQAENTKAMYDKLIARKQKNLDKWIEKLRKDGKVKNHYAISSKVADKMEGFIPTEKLQNGRYGLFAADLYKYSGLPVYYNGFEITDETARKVYGIRKKEIEKLIEKQAEAVNDARLGIMFSISGSPTPTPDESVAEFANRYRAWQRAQIHGNIEEEYEKLVIEGAKTTEALKRRWIDAYQPIEDFQDWAVKMGGTMKEGADAYNYAFLAKGRTTAQIERLHLRFINPLVDIYKGIIKSVKKGTINLPTMRWQGFDEKGVAEKDRKNGTALTTQEIIGVYLQAMDVKEAIEMGLPDRGQEGFVNNLGMTHEEVIDLVENAIGQENVDKLWDVVNGITNFALQFELDGGLIDKETYDAYQDRKYYVPQRGWREPDVVKKPTEYRKGGKNSNGAYNAPFVKAKGRTSLASDPIAYMISIAESAVVATENNAIKQHFLKFLLDNEELGLKSGAFKMQKVWIFNNIDPVTGKIALDEHGNKKPPIILPTEPTKAQREHDKNIQDQLKVWRKRLNNEKKPSVRRAIEVKIQQLEDSLYIRHYVNASTLEMLSDEHKQQHKVIVVKDGQRYTIELRDEKLANAINKNFKREQEEIINVGGRVRNATRWMSAMLTQYNPEFAIRNFVKDSQVAYITLRTEQGFGFAMEFIGSLANAQKTIWKYTFNEKVKGKELFDNSEMGTYLEEYFMSGAATGFSFLREIGATRADFEKMLKNGKAKKIGQAIGGTLSMLTEVSELSTRFAAYVTARKRGMSIEKSATLAKELTTNFDRSGENSNSAFMSYFSFFKATINGNWKFARMLKKASASVLSVGAAYALLGVLNTLIKPNDAEKEFYVNDYTRGTHILIGSWKIPVAHFFSMFYGMGVNFAQWLLNEKTFENALYSTISQISGEILPSWSNLLAWTKWNSITNRAEWDIKGGAQGMAPTAISPFTDVLLNTDYKGTTINREPFAKTQENTKDIMMGKKRTGQFYKDLAEGIYEGVGGDLSIKNKMDDNWIQDKADISPSTYEHIIEGYTSGTGDLLFTTIGAIAKGISKEDEVTTYDVPIIRKFKTHYSIESAFHSEYNKLNKRYKAYQQLLDEYEDGEDEDTMKKYIEMKQKYGAILLESETVLNNININEENEQNLYNPDLIKRMQELNKKWNKID